MSDKEKARHKKEMDEYEKKGYFTNSDGVKSNSIIPENNKIKFLDHVVLPKKPCSGHMCYVNTEYKKSSKQEG